MVLTVWSRPSYRGFSDFEFDFSANGDMFGWQNGEQSQQMGWGRELPRKQESASTAEFGSSDHLDP
jgi:hypothetical protein